MPPKYAIMRLARSTKQVRLHSEVHCLVQLRCISYLASEDIEYRSATVIYYIERV